MDKYTTRAHADIYQPNLKRFDSATVLTGGFVSKAMEEGEERRDGHEGETGEKRGRSTSEMRGGEERGKEGKRREREGATGREWRGAEEWREEEDERKRLKRTRERKRGRRGETLRERKGGDRKPEGGSAYCSR